MGLRKKSKHKILIFGGSGFIGRALAESAAHQEYEVTIVSRTSSLASKIHPAINVVQHDIQSGPSSIIQKLSFDYVINCAGNISHQEFNFNDQYPINTHYFGLLNIISSLQIKGMKKFIQLGSSDEYGFNKAPQHESFRENPQTPYAFSKTAATHLIQMLVKNINFPGLIIRPFLAYGPHQKSNRLIPYVVRSCLENKEFNISSGTQLKDFLYIDDLIEAIFLCLDADQSLNGKIFNIASGQPISIKELVRVIQALCQGGSANFGARHLPAKENFELYGDITSANDHLGWKPRTSLENGLDKVISHIRNNG